MGNGTSSYDITPENLALIERDMLQLSQIPAD